MDSLLLQFFGLNALRNSCLPLALALALVSTLSTAHAVSPPPDGGYSNFNTAEGDNALFKLTNGPANTAVGFDALFNNTTGAGNTATGFNALKFNDTGTHNTATGIGALTNNNADDNTATGSGALQFNTTGNSNTANGSDALHFNTTGDANTGNGVQALATNKTGSFNTATGVNALLNNTSSDNTADGADALQDNVTGYQNVASGAAALLSNTSGHDNTAGGFQALLHNTTGSNNIALGARAGVNLTTGSNNIDIGAFGGAGESGTIRIGLGRLQHATIIAGISGTAVAGPVVHVNASGQLGIAPSSERFKVAIKSMDKSSEAILNLKPVSFHYKEDLDPDKIPQFGLVAEEVEKVNPDLVVHDDSGKPFTVRYEAVNAMLLNEFLKEHRKAQVEESKVAELQATVAKQQKQLEALIAGLQKVTARVESDRTASRVVNSN
jgi:hypothetical protein